MASNEVVEGDIVEGVGWDAFIGDLQQAEGHRDFNEEEVCIE